MNEEEIMGNKENLKSAILEAANCKIAPKDIDVVRGTVIVEIPIDDLMEIIESHINKLLTTNKKEEV